MKNITVTATRGIKLGEVDVAFPLQADIVEYAIAAYGYLLLSEPPREYSLSEFADIIAHHYDMAMFSRHRIVIETLVTVQAQTERVLATVH